MLGIMVILLWLSRRQALWHERGWGFILAGFALIAFAVVIDITDEYEGLAEYEVIGDTEIQGLLEKVVGFLFGFSLLAVGLLRWLPHIAARRKAEEKLQAAEARYEDLYEHAADMHFSISPHRAEVLGCNQTLADKLGLTKSEIIGKVVFDLYHPDCHGAAREALRIFSSTGDVQDVELQVMRRDGTTIDVSLNVTAARDESGNIHHSRSSWRDITDSKRAQRESLERERQVQVAEETTRTLERFVATMSHEIRTPMHGVLGMTDLLLRTDLDDEQRQWTGVAHDSAQALVKIIDDTLNLSRVLAGQLDPELADFDLASTVHECADLFGAEIREKNLTMSASLDPAIPSVLRGNARSVRQVLLNLVSNAVKFTDRGEVAIKAEMKNGQDSSVRVRFTVSDTGPGVPDSVRSTIFEPFARADRVVPGFRSSGLGLAICKQLVELLGGEIGFESYTGRGSTFWFTVELERARGVAEHARQSKGGGTALESPSQTGATLPLPTVLLVDDDDTGRLITLKMLELLNCRAEAVETGREAVEAFEQHDYDLVLMDCVLPDMSGFDATRMIRKADAAQARHTPVVALTASAVQETRDACLAAGMDAYMTKPLTLEYLGSVLSRWLPISGPKGPVAKNDADEQANLPQERAEPVDPDALSRLIDDFDTDEETVRSVLAAYLEQLPERRAAIERGLIDGDSEAVYKVAHTLKSASAALGATALAELCERLESAGRSGDLAHAQTTVEQLAEECYRVAAALESWPGVAET